MMAAHQICHLGRLYISSDAVIDQDISEMPLLKLFSLLWRRKKIQCLVTLQLHLGFDTKLKTPRLVTKVPQLMKKSLKEITVFRQQISAALENVGRIVLQGSE